MSGELDQQLFQVVTHLVSSAPVSLDETPILAAFRMVDGANRLIALAEGSDSFGEDAFLAEARADYLAHFNLVMTDQVAFESWLTGYVRRFTKEALRRANAAADTGPAPAA
ncbi:MAG: hypothetical protein JWR28_508 [Modestobacter sp.]|jgi:hypothetical protein|nr:hypothetical protein [Modestobacter sp.]MCW2617359.1 hypothetical protein [Modestobacter sp.]